MSFLKKRNYVILCAHLVKAPVPGDLKALMSSMGSVDKGSADTKIIGEDNLLLCSTEVKGRAFGEVQEMRGYVPADRVMIEEV